MPTRKPLPSLTTSTIPALSPVAALTATSTSAKGDLGSRPFAFSSTTSVLVSCRWCSKPQRPRLKGGYRKPAGAAQPDCQLAHEREPRGPAKRHSRCFPASVIGHLDARANSEHVWQEKSKDWRKDQHEPFCES